MRRVLTALAALVLTSGALGLLPVAHAEPGHTVQTLHFKVRVGPDARRPATSSATCTCPPTRAATTGCRPSSPPTGSAGPRTTRPASGRPSPSAATSCSPTPASASAAPAARSPSTTRTGTASPARQLVSYLGGASGIAFTDAAHTHPAPPLDVVVTDAVGHDGQPHAHDPRVGMVGGSYGGQIQFAVASVDPRVDTIVPIITWNDLSYSLGPNNTAQTTGVSTSTPGATKLTWGLGFSVLGMANGLQNAQDDPSRLLPLPELRLLRLPGTGHRRHRGVLRRRRRSTRCGTPRWPPTSTGSGSRPCWCRARPTPCSTSTRRSRPTRRSRRRGRR